MQEQSESDYAFWWGEKGSVRFGKDWNPLVRYDPGTFTQAEFATLRKPFETMTAIVESPDLQQFHELWMAKGELVSFPKLVLESTRSGQAIQNLHSHGPGLFSGATPESTRLREIRASCGDARFGDQVIRQRLTSPRKCNDSDDI